MSILVHIADRALMRPLMITPEKAEIIVSFLAGRLGVDAPVASRFEGSDVVQDNEGRYQSVPYRVSNGVAIITITGSLVNRGAWIGASSGLTSYEGIGHQLKTAMNDDAVHSVILDMQTPGGEAVGAFEIAAKVRELAASKRTIAVVNGMAASAGYAIASGATEIVTTETGISGSIGVVMIHADFSRQLDADGVTPTLIHAGAHKVDGNPFEPLSAQVKSDLQKEVSDFYDLFLATVAKGRGNRLTIEAARKTEAKTFMGEAAVDAGLADRIGTFDSVLAELTRAKTPKGGRLISPNRSSSMSENNGVPAAENAGISQADHERAVADAQQSGFKSGEQAATDRLSAALGAEGIKGDAGRMAAALDLAVKSPSMSGEDVAAFVAANVGAVASSAPSQQQYEANRMAGAGLAKPGDEPAAKSSLSERMTAHIEKLKPSR